MAEGANVGRGGAGAVGVEVDPAANAPVSDLSELQSRTEIGALALTGTSRRTCGPTSSSQQSAITGPGPRYIKH